MEGCGKDAEKSQRSEYYKGELRPSAVGRDASAEKFRKRTTLRVSASHC